MLDAIWVYGGDTIGREEKIEEDMYMCESDFRARGRQRVTRPRAGAYRMTKDLPRELCIRLLPVPGAVRTQLLELPVRLLPLDASGAPGGALAAEQRRAALGELEVDEDRDGEEPVEDVAQDRADCGSFAVRVPSTSGGRASGGDRAKVFHATGTGTDTVRASEQATIDH